MLPPLLFIVVLSSSAVFGSSHAVLHELSNRREEVAERGIHLPIYRQETRKRLSKRDGQTGAIGLGDYLDVTYNVLVTLGDTATPVVLDTGSSDLWVISDSCTNCSSSNIPLYPQATFEPSGLDANLLYGDSLTGTHANGPIGQDTVALAGLSLSNQFFAAINSTNTSVLETGSAGIFGLGFPLNSAIWTEVISQSLSTSSRRDIEPANSYSTRFFPHLSDLQKTSSFPYSVSTRDDSTSITAAILASYPTIGPFLPRLVATNAISAPMFTVTIQRDTVDIGGNVGLLSIGELPPGVQNDSLTWVDVRTYTPSQGGLPAPTDSPQETYPIAWEVFIDDVFLDGQILSRSNLSSSTIALSALIDTGNSLIRGPDDVIQSILTSIGGDRFSCSTPHTLAFQIGGKLFPVDPRDFISQTFTNSVADCTPNLASTDPPVEGKGYLYSWSLGDPFLKSVLASFHFGNLTYPSQDAPRIGFLSTVPADANDLLQADVSSASAMGHNFPATSDTAPTGTFTAAGSNSNGVQQVQQTQSSSDPTSSSGGKTSIAIPPKEMALWTVWLAILILCLM